jgi:hypothetical protein
MIRYIIRYGVIAGLMVAIPMTAYMLSLPADAQSPPSMLATYLIMLVSLGMVFVGIWRYRDQVLGGVINFTPALGLGLAISAVAGLFYAAAWEVSQVFMKFDFATFYANSMVENVRAAGGSPEAVAAAAKRAEDFLQLYANPFFRVPMTFLEIFPVGVLVSLLSAGLLRNSGFLPAGPAS